MPRAIVLTSLRHDGRRYQPGDTVELSTEAATRLAASGTICDIMPDEALPLGVAAPGLSELGLALDLVADTFGFQDVQELCTAMDAYIDNRNSQGATEFQSVPAAVGKPQIEGAEAAGPGAPDAITGPVIAAATQDAPDAGAAAPASVPSVAAAPARKAGGKKPAAG